MNERSERMPETEKNSRINNRGMTLMEVMLALSIAALVLLSLVFVFGSSMKNYHRSNDTAALSMEAQTVLNQMSDMIMEAYNVKMDNDRKLLSIYQRDSIYYIKLQDNKLYLQKKVSPLPEEAGGDWSLLGQYIKDFKVTDTGTDDDNTVITVSVYLKKDKMELAVEDNKIMLRNKIEKVPH